MINKLATPKQLQKILQILLQQPIPQQQEIASILQNQQIIEDQKLRQILLQIVREQETKIGQQQQEIRKIIYNQNQQLINDKVNAIVKAFPNWQEQKEQIILQILQKQNLTLDGQVDAIVQEFSYWQEQIIQGTLQTRKLTVNNQIHIIAQAFPGWQEPKIQKILQNPDLTVNDKVNEIVQAFSDLQKPKIQKILQNPDLIVNDKVDEIVRAVSDLQKPRIQTILEYKNQNLNVNDKVNLIFQTFQNLQDQRTLEIFKILLLLETKITDDAINEVDSVIKSLVREINSSKNFRDIQTINQKLDKLMNLKKVLHENSNSDSIKTIVDELFNHDDLNGNSAVTRDKDDQGKALITNAARYLYLLRNSTQSLDKGKIHDPALGLELFRTYRSMIEHEDTLLSQRINWFLVTQGFLFAAFATAISVEVISLPILCFLLAISGAGYIYSYSISNPISLALLAIDTRKREWKRRLSKLTTDQVYKLLPIQVCFDAEEPTNIKNKPNHDDNRCLPNYHKNYYKDKDYEYLPQYYGDWLNWSNWCPLFEKPKSENYRKKINLIYRGTGIIWFIILLFVLNSLISHIYPIPPLREKHSYYLKIESSNLIQDRFNINKANLGLRAAICSIQDQPVLAIRPTNNLFFNLSQDSAKKYDSLVVPVSRSATDGGSNTTNNLKLTKVPGKLESCQE